MQASLSADIALISALSAQKSFDYIVVGSGLGGGILARKLVEGGQRTLLVEKGDILFTTHCLNTSRPHWQAGSILGPSQDNDVVYNSVKQKVQTAAGSDPYVGGPVYCLGGRSTVWGLFAPQISNATCKRSFPKRIKDSLPELYKEAFSLMSNGSQEDNIYPVSLDVEKEKNDTMANLKEAIEKFYNSSDVKASENSSTPTVSLAPIAAEFQSKNLYQFPQGAYSTADALLDMAYGRNPNLTLLLSTEAMYLTYEELPYVSNSDGSNNSEEPDSPEGLNSENPSNSKGSGNYVARTLTVRSTSDQRREFQISARKGIILCAGTIETARIALNSGLQQTHPLVGKGLTDHEIWGVRFMKEKKSHVSPKYPLKLQSEIHICNREALLNVVVNANTLFGRNCSIYTPPTQSIDKKGQLKMKAPCLLTGGKSAEESTEYDTVNITLEFGAELSPTNKVLKSAARDPTIDITRATDLLCEDFQREMQSLATNIRDSIVQVLPEPAPRMSLAGFGVVAHEVGTMRLESPKYAEFVVDKNFRVKGFSNLYVCDLSIFPVSPPANPSLTLVALALQLARDLNNIEDRCRC